MEATPLITAILRVAAGRLVEGGSTEAKPQDSGFVPITGPVPELDHWKVSADTLKIQMLWCDGVMPGTGTGPLEGQCRHFENSDVMV